MQIDIELFCKKISQDDERIIFGYNGKKYALLSYEDLDYLEALEDRRLCALADSAIQELEMNGEKPVPWEEVKKELGIS
ncbi:MAG: type II toxin-antitoxin system Phd/YefM family antitoxin [Candidatus Omnitrophota bacterium]|nr:MAG: type II toxin-antitoxin system Phd/YefM family antitoxin [Candidatus Omnitrophota bacterium]